MHKFLLVTAAVAVAMILPVMALAENDQFNPDQNTGVVGGSNSSTVKEPEGSAVKEPEGAANETKVPETGKPIVSAEDVAVTERLQDLVENKLQQYVPRAQDRAGIEAFYRKRDFAPLWVGTGKLLPHGQQATDFLHSVAADGLDPRDYPTPRFADPDPSRARRGRTDFNELNRRFCAACQHWTRGLCPGKRRDRFRLKGSRSRKSAGSNRYQQGYSRYPGFL